MERLETRDEIGLSIRFWRWLTLKTYGRYLLLDDGANWLFGIRPVMLILIAIECCSWGYFAHTSVPSEWASIVTTIVVTMTFCVNWALDSTIMTLDRDRVHAAAIERRPLQQPSSILDGKAIFVAIAGRLGMIGAVLYFSSPFTVQAIFSKDIDLGLANLNRTQLELKLKELLSPLQALAEQQRTRIQKLRDDLIVETQGRSRDHLAGHGPAARAIESTIEASELKLKETESQIAGIETEFHTLSGEQIRAKYHMPKVDGPTQRGEVVEQLKSNESFRRTEQAIRSLLIILFVGLLLLKWFQPPSITLYYSSVLQDLHTQYRRGRFDKWLEKPDRRHNAANGGMTPFEFSEWILSDYGRTVRDAAAAAEAADRRAALTRLEDDYNLRSGALQTEKKEIEAQLEPVQKRLDDAMDRKEGLNATLRRVGSDEADARRSLDDLSTRQSELRKQLNTEELPEESYAPSATASPH